MVSAKDFDAPEWNTRVNIAAAALILQTPFLFIFFAVLSYGKYCVQNLQSGYFT
jgi:hypothetical protein